MKAQTINEKFHLIKWDNNNRRTLIHLEEVAAVGINEASQKVHVWLKGQDESFHFERNDEGVQELIDLLMPETK